MEKKMRRKELLSDPGKTEEVLKSGEYGTLSTVDSDGDVHAVPLSYVYHNGEIVFHCAPDGLKIDNMRANPNVCFSVVTHNEPIFRRDDYTALYASAVVYGKAVEVTEELEKIDLLRALCERYMPDKMDSFQSALKPLHRTAVYRIIPRRITGKSNLHRRDA